MKISNWGLFPWIDAQTVSSKEELIDQLKEKSTLIARGMGRCYGDSSLNDLIWSALQYSEIVEFDDRTGRVTCEAGVTLEKILSVVVPKGWFLPVTPGTKYVSVGGAVASDIHGKNHHNLGGFCQHLFWFKLMLADGKIVTCSSTDNSDLFNATCGGMGLTGCILEASFQLLKIETSYIRQTQLKLPNIDAAIDAFEQMSAVTYSVAWIDCLATGANLGRSVLFLGEHARLDELSDRERQEPLVVDVKPKRSIPFYFPKFALSTWSVKLFNWVYYYGHPAKRESLVHYGPFFYPLDKILHWNRMYGRRGFTQYQCVIPKNCGREGMNAILKELSQSGEGSFLAVLKLLGPEDFLISFPMEGYTLALDIPIKSKNFELMNRLDQIVLRYGGRLYLSKDARMPAEMMRKGYPKLPQFIDIKQKFDPNRQFESLQSKRLGLQ